MKKIITLLLGMVLLCAYASAQRTVTGKVTDEKGNALANVSVLVKGTTTGTITNNNGVYSLNVPANGRVLIFSSVDMETVEATIGTQGQVNATLKTIEKALQEVVVTGFGTSRKKRDEAGAISTVLGAQIENKPTVSLDKALQGKAAGVFVQANNGIPGGAINVRIRGAGSINAGNSPLYIVDGIQLNSRDDAAFTQSNPLSFLNPDDIQSIDIMKDAASAAIYGSNAANGVVIVTTKKGRAGKTKFTFNTYYGKSSPLKILDVANAQQYYQLRLEAYANSNNLPASNLTMKRTVLAELRVPGAAAFTDFQADSAALALTTYDWQDEAFRTGTIQNYELAVSGGNEKTTFRLSANLMNQATIVTKADFKRYGLKVDVTNKATDRLTLNSSVNLSTFVQKLPFATDGSFLGSPAFSASGIIPTNPIYNPDGSYYGIPGSNPANIVGTLNQNIIAVNDFNSGFQRTNQLIGNLNTDYKITSWLSFKLYGGLDYRLVQGKSVRDARTPDGFNRKGLVQVQSNWNTNINAYGTLNFAKSFSGKHTVDALVGYEYRRENNESITASGDGFPTFQFTSLNNAANPVSIGEFFTGFRRNAVFGNVNYNYDSRYLIGFVMRYDGSSRFGSGFKYGTFSGVKAAWNIDRENFMTGMSKAVSTLRLRFSYGSVGNDQIGNFDGLGLFGGGGVYNGGAGIAYTQLANPNLKWESTTISNLGIDFGFWNNRITGTIEAYNKKTSDVLLTLPLQSTTGFTGIASNIGKTQNKGVELTLNFTPFRAKSKGDFEWELGFVFAYNKQEVKELYDGLKILPSNNAIQVGQPVNFLFTQKYGGVNPATGRPLWYDSLGNITYQVLAKDRVILGPTLLAPYNGGLTSTFRYKGFTLDAAFNYEYGRWSSDGQINFLREATGRINMLKEIYVNRWTTPGQLTHVPRFNLATESKSSGPASGNRTFFKADYVRLRNVTLSYEVKPAWLTKAKLNSARVYLQGTNLITYSDWFSYDIEFVNTATGIIPQTKNITVGVQIGF
ncbi:MAG: SusC/RagA family TonB-linked outer membrane protein [Bacteroidota bacterium]